MKKILAFLLAALFALPLGIGVFADSEKSANVPSEFGSVSKEFTHDDGSVTTIYADGSVGTKYPDGTFEGIDEEGNRHTMDKDGTYSVFGSDGSVAVERPDGTKELTEKTGTKTVLNPDGSGKTVYSNGLVIEHDKEFNQTCTYFEGGSEKLTADENGDFPTGEIKGKNGEMLKNTENGLYLKGANGVEYDLDTEKDSASIKFKDGTSLESEKGNGTIRFADGAVFTATGGKSKFVSPDGSYVYIDSDSEAWELFNSDDGSFVKVNEKGELTDMFSESDGNKIRITNGQLSEWNDAEAGVYILCDKNGTTFKTPEGTYFTDGKGNVTKDGEPLNTKEEKKPTGWKLPEGYDDTRCDDSFDNKKLWRSKWNEHSFDGEYYDKDNGIFYADWIHQVWDDEHKQLYLQERYDMTARMQKIENQNGEWLEDAWYSIEAADCIGYYKNLDEINMIDGQSRMELKVDGYDAVYVYSEDRTPGDSKSGVLPYSWNKGKIYVQIGDLPNCYGKVSMFVIACSISGYNFDIYDSLYAEYLSLLQSLPCKIDVKKEEEVFKEMDTEEEPPSEDPGYVKYNGRLTYTNGATNKYGQPFPDLMDFDGDGDIDYADRQIQYILVHNPDALDTPEGAALVLTSLLAALLGAGGGIAFNVFSGAAGSAGSALSFDFSGEGGSDGDDNDDNDDGKQKESGEENGGASSSDTPQKEDLGPHIRRDADGDLNVTDPATGEQRLYTANGDGTYTNPLTGATYTEEELKDSLESRADNADLIRQDQAAAKKAIEDQREQGKGLSEFSKELEEQARKERAEQEAAIRHESYVEQLEIKYDAEGNELKKAIMQEQIDAEVEGNRQMAKEAYMEAGQKTAESTEKAADVAIDVLAEVTGEEGKAIKDAYTFTKSTLARGAEAYAEGKSVTQGMVHGAIEGSVSVAQNHVEGAGNKLAANVGGDMFKTALESTAKGEKVDFGKVVESGGMAAINTAVDVGFDAAGDLVKGVGDLGENAVGKVFNTVITSEGAADAAKAGLGDLAKEGAEKIFKTDDD